MQSSKRKCPNRSHPIDSNYPFNIEIERVVCPILTAFSVSKPSYTYITVYMQQSGRYPWTNRVDIPTFPTLFNPFSTASRQNERAAEIARSGGRGINHSYTTESHIGF